MRRLQLVDQRIVERRNVAVLLRAKALEPGLAGMDDDAPPRPPPDARRPARTGLARLLLVDADAAFDGDRERDRRAIAATHSATSSGSRIRQAPKRPLCTRSDGQPH